MIQGSVNTNAVEHDTALTRPNGLAFSGRLEGTTFIDWERLFLLPDGKNAPIQLLRCNTGLGRRDGACYALPMPSCALAGKNVASSRVSPIWIFRRTINDAHL